MKNAARRLGSSNFANLRRAHRRRGGARNVNTTLAGAIGSSRRTGSRSARSRGSTAYSGPPQGRGAGHAAHAAAERPLLARCEYPLPVALVTDAAPGAGAREKRVAAAFPGAAAGALQDPPLLREPAQAAARENRERFAQRYARAQSAAVAALRSEPRPCS